MEITLGKRISGYRKALGLTQDQLAEKLGLTAQAVSKWENDLSCPDITVIPKLADIFCVTTDELLGHKVSVPEEPTITANQTQDSGPVLEFDSKKGTMDFHWGGIKMEGIGLACWVLLTGAIYLISQLIPIDVSFWNILWPSFLLVLGLFGLYPRFSVIRLGCALVGGYFLADKLLLLEFQLNKGILFAAVILLFGLSLLIEVLRKNRRRSNAYYTDRNGGTHQGRICNDYSVSENTFCYDASFGSNTQIVQLGKLKSGQISTNFGEYTLDLSGIAALEDPCRIEANCSFGELTILIPRSFTVIPDSSTSFAGFEIKGQPSSNPSGMIHLNADVSFGEICIQYI